MRCLQLNPSHFPLSQLFRDSCNFPLLIDLMSTVQVFWTNHKNFPAKSLLELLTNKQNRQEAVRLVLAAIFEFDLGLCRHNSCHTIEQRRNLLWEAFEADRSFVCHIINFLIFVGGEMSREIIGRLWKEHMKVRGIEIPSVVSTYDGSQQMLDQHLLDLIAILDWPNPIILINGLQGPSTSLLPRFGSPVPSTSTTVSSTSSLHSSTRHPNQAPVQRRGTPNSRPSTTSGRGYPWPTNLLPWLGSPAPSTSTMPANHGNQGAGSSTRGIKKVQKLVKNPPSPPSPPRKRKAAREAAEKLKQQKVEEMEMDKNECGCGVYCLCPESPNLHWIKCDDCGQWFNGFCLYLLNTKSVLPDEFSCCGAQPTQAAVDGLGGVVFRRYQDLPNPKPTAANTYRP
ncbi:hypothetical protein L3Y34_013655 [Caenorhabditis briggsae]|uniref:Zinc finger PHD-type domain-containing protein n=1 Tax=Caenorhabditis briggsae TaxID=6238 RepID=A0AAE8ZUW1_CAEBR|nr:hypothetical protein L3Y34_013655 [Caenorhabditis briggsae]